MEAALQETDGACVFSDFKSAFPSVSQDYIHAVLEHIGLPSSVRNLVRSLYDRHKSQLNFQG